MQKKIERKTLVAVKRENHTLKASRGITLIALIVTIIVLIILASITISTLTGNNSIINMVLDAREKTEIANEKEQLEISAAQAMGKNKFGEVKKRGLQKALDRNVGENVTEVSDEEDSTDLYVEFVESKRIYIVTSDGKITYIGDEEKLSKTAEITADPASDPTPKLAHTVTLTVKTGIIMNEENLRLKYAWSKSATQEPEEFTTVELTGSGRTKKVSVTTVDTEEGDYYLWAKAFLGENMETEINLKKPFGPYRIKDHSTLRYCKNESWSTSTFLNSYTVTRGKVKNVTLVNSLQGHSLDEANCWDVSQEQKGKILAWYEVDENGYYSVTIGQDGGVTANVDSSWLFNHIGFSVTNGTEVKIEGLENLDTSNVTNMRCMFYACGKLTSLDVSKLDTSKVTNMDSMFSGCSRLTSLDVSEFNTSKVTDMSGMFVSCDGLTSLDVNNFNTSNVTNMWEMFAGCRGLTSLDVSNFNTSNVTNIGHMFYGCSKLTSLDVSNFNTSNVTSMSEIFSYCSELTTIDVGKLDTSKVTRMDGMFNFCSKLTSIDVSNFNTSKVTNMFKMFWWCRGLTSIDVSKFDTSNVTDMSNMFSYCSGLTSIDVSKFDTSKVTNMSYMFSYCSGLTSIDVSKFDTSKVTGMSEIFAGCSGLTSIDVSKFDTSNVTGMRHMFRDCYKLTNIDVSKFDTSNVTNMSNMFTNCSRLTSIDVSKFNTSKVTSMDRMFYSCSGLTSLDVSNFDTSNVTNMEEMFRKCSGLTSLNLQNFDMSNVTSYSSVFSSVPTSVAITTNQAAKDWLEEKGFSDWLGNVTIVEKTI